MSEKLCECLGYRPQLAEDNRKVVDSIIADLVPICKGRTIEQVDRAFRIVLESIQSYQPIGAVFVDRSRPD